MYIHYTQYIKYIFVCTLHTVHKVHICMYTTHSTLNTYLYVHYTVHKVHICMYNTYNTCQLCIKGAVNHCTEMITFLSTLSSPHILPPLHHHNWVQHSVCNGRTQEMSWVDSHTVSTGTNGMDRTGSKSPSVYRRGIKQVIGVEHSYGCCPHTQITKAFFSGLEEPLLKILDSVKPLHSIVQFQILGISKSAIFFT